MNSEEPEIKLGDTAWLQAPSVQKVFTMFEVAGAEIRVAGGAVRNAILNEAITDIDFATTATPDEVVEIAKSNNVSVKPIGYEHGTVILLVGNDKFEVTTLRQDVKTFGRSAEVEFGKDWIKDSHRRDFTMNALYADKEGNVYDYVGGVKDCKNKTLKFIGCAEQRIKEDYLRILRYFRFLSKYANHMPDDQTLKAVIRNKDGLNNLSRERVRMELLKLLETPNVIRVAKCMDQNDLLEILLDGNYHLDRLNNLVELSKDPILRLYALAVDTVEDIDRIAEKLGLSNKERKRMHAVLDVSNSCKSSFTDFEIYLLLYQFGRDAAVDGAKIACAREYSLASFEKWESISRKLEVFEIPEFPVTGKDLVATGLDPGKIIGEKLKFGEELWVQSGFLLNRDEIIQQLDP